MSAVAIHHLFIEKGWTLSVAESCTGGSLSARLIAMPGSSRYFLGSVVAYSNLLKMRLLDVPENIIFEHGAVSQEVVKAMLAGILSVTGSDFAVAVSGIAGPDGGTQAKPVGTVWGGIGFKSAQPHLWSWHEEGSRPLIIQKSVDRLLDELLLQTESL